MVFKISVYVYDFVMLNFAFINYLKISNMNVFICILFKIMYDSLL